MSETIELSNKLVEDIGDYRLEITTFKDKRDYRLVNTIINMFMVSEINTKYSRLYNVIVINKARHSIDGVCAIYMKHFLVSICVGTSEAINLIARRMRLKSILVPHEINIEAKEYRKFLSSFGLMNQYILF